jgi:beta-propeller repeat-containing protein
MRALPLVAGIVALTSICAAGARAVGGAESRPRASAVRADVRGAPAPSRLVFEENRGQTDARVAFVVRQRGFTAFLAPASATFALPRTDDASACDAVRIAFRGAGDPGPMRGLLPTGGVSTYVRGARAVSGARHFASTVTTGLRPGVDLRWRGDDRGRLTYDLVVSPGADPACVEFDVAGGTAVRVASDGSLRIATGCGELTQSRPVVYQDTAAGRVEVEGAFALRGARRVGFAVGAHDATAPLVIDPSIEYASYLGGGANDDPNAIAVDAAGAAYVTGQTFSADFPADPGTGGTLGGEADAFVTKLTPDGSAVAWAMYLGGSLRDAGEGVAVNARGEAVVCGTADSADFPLVVAAGAPPGEQPAFPGTYVAKIAADGRSLLFSRSLGAAWPGSAVTLDPQGDAYVLGTTHYDTPRATPGAFQETRNGWSDAFVVKLDGETSEVRFATFLGGASEEYAKRIAVDAQGSAYVCGTTRGSASFPATARFAPPEADLGSDAFVAKLSPDGSSLSYAVTYGAKTANGIAVDADGAAYVTGAKERDEFPLTNVPRGVKERPWAAYVMKISPAGDAPEYAAVLAGSEVPPPGSEYAWSGGEGYDVAVDATGAAYVLANTSQPFGPPYALAEHSIRGGYLARLSPDARRMTYAARTGFGDATHALALGPDGSLFLTGPHWTGNMVNATLLPLRGAERREDDVYVAKYAPQNARMTLVSGDAWDGPGLRDRVQCVVRHPFARADHPFDPRTQDVTVAVGAGADVRTLTIPARDAGWRSGGGAWVWQSAPGARPFWRVAFAGRDVAQILLRYAGLSAPLDNPFTIDLGVGDERASEMRHWPRLPGAGPAHHRLR